MANTDVSPRLETRVGRDFPPEAAEQVIALLQTVPDIHSASRQDAERLQLFDFIADCEKDATAKIDVFAYDLDEPTSSLRSTGSASRAGCARCSTMRIAFQSRQEHRRFPDRGDGGQDDHRRGGRRKCQAGQVQALPAQQGVHQARCERKRAEGDLRLDESLGSRNLRAGQQRRIRRNSHSRAHWPSLQSLFQAEKKRYYSAVVARRSA